MCLEESKLNRVIEVTYYDSFHSYKRTNTVENHRMFIDEYHSANGTTLDEHEIDCDDEEIIDYLS